MEIELRGIFVILLNRMGLTLCLVSLIWLHTLSHQFDIIFLIFFFLFKHTWIKPNFFKESTFNQNQTYTRANYSNIKQNPAQKHKFDPDNSLIKFQILEILWEKNKKKEKDC